MAESISEMITELEEDEVLSEVRSSLDRGDDPLSLVEELREGMGVVGKRFEEKEYFLSELIMSSEIFKGAIALIEPYLTAGSSKSKGVIVLGTVKGDIHYIGKDIVGTMLRCEGYEVHDVGVDADPSAFVAKLKETGAPLLALSGLLTLAFDSMKETIEAVSSAGLRSSVKVMIGGGPVTEKVVEYTGADGFGRDAASAVGLAKQLMAS